MSKKLLSSKPPISSEVVNYILTWLDTVPRIRIVVIFNFTENRNKVMAALFFPRASDNFSPEFFITNLQHETKSKHGISVLIKPWSENFHLRRYTEWQLDRQEKGKNQFYEPLTLQQKCTPKVDNDTLNEYPTQDLLLELPW